MFVRGRTKILCRHVQINLRTRDLFVTEKITNGNDVNAGLDEMCCERMAKTMRRDSFTNLCTIPPGANAFVDRAA